MRIDPLRHNVPIADKQGHPTPEFLRLWQILLSELHETKERVRALEEIIQP